MSTQSIQFGRLAPTLSVTEMDRSLRFYTEILGMKKTFENGSPVGFVILERGEAELHLTLTKAVPASDLTSRQTARAF
jgi:catechol 2,3-dioxygenase-like lactoylglutathione lyase family enzyme